jgi:hypothetical protein
MGRCRPDYSLNLRRIITSRNDAALSVRTIRKRHLRTRMSGVVGAGGVNAPRYPILLVCHIEKLQNGVNSAHPS